MTAGGDAELSGSDRSARSRESLPEDEHEVRESAHRADELRSQRRAIEDSAGINPARSQHSPGAPDAVAPPQRRGRRDRRGR